jgi:DNA polymerase I-like protein with 3'-5' exonuclease and polymerase domains
LLNAGTAVKLAHDIETLGPIITCMGFADSSTSALVVPFIKKQGDSFASRWSAKEEATLTRLICAILSHRNLLTIGQYYQYDSTYIHKLLGIVPYLFHDTHGAQHLLFPGTTKDLGYLSSIYCEYHRYWKDDNKEWNAKGDLASHFYYNGEDCIRTFEIHEKQLAVIAAKHLEPLWSRTLARHHMALEMSLVGIRINTTMKAELALDLSYQSQLRTAWLLKIVPQRFVDEWNGGPTFRKKPGQAKLQVFWPSSTAQQKVLFYEIFQMAGQRHRKTKRPTLDKEAIPKLRARYPFAQRIFDALLELRSIDVFASTFVNARIDPDKRMRTSFNAAGTETFRWSSSTNPFGTGGNFQNLPKGKELE